MFLGLLALQSEQVLPAVAEAMVLCYRTVIPSLFPFFVLSGLLLSGGFAEQCAGWLSVIMKPLFNVGGAGALSFVIGLISGYPMGSKVTAELYKNGDISKTEAERLLPFCNNSGPLFVIGAVGVGMFGSSKVGMFLYVIHAVCALLVGICFRFYGGQFQQRTGCIHDRRKAVDKNFATAVSSGVDTVLMVCGYILLFAAIMACLLPLAETFLHAEWLLGLRGFAEVTSGCFAVVQSQLSLRLKVSLVAGFLGLGGLCVMLQAKGMLQGTEICFNTYVSGKALHGVLSALTAFFFYPYVSSEAVSAFAMMNRQQNWSSALNDAAGLSGALIVFSCIFCASSSKNQKEDNKNSVKTTKNYKRFLAFISTPFR